MRKLSPYKLGFFGGLVFIAISALFFAGGAAALRMIDPEDVSQGLGQSEDLSAAGSPATVSLSGDIGVGELRVFQTSAAVNGAGPAGYGRTAMHDACRSEDPASHFCTIQEIESAWKTSGVELAQTGQAWVDNAVLGTINPGYIGDTALASDWYGGNAVGDYPYNCNAWTISANTGRGMILNDGAISPAVESCDDIHPIACCTRLTTRVLLFPLVAR